MLGPGAPQGAEDDGAHYRARTNAEDAAANTATATATAGPEAGREAAGGAARGQGASGVSEVSHTENQVLRRGARVRELRRGDQGVPVPAAGEKGDAAGVAVGRAGGENRVFGGPAGGGGAGGGGGGARGERRGRGRRGGRRGREHPVPVVQDGPGAERYVLRDVVGTGV